LSGLPITAVMTVLLAPMLLVGLVLFPLWIGQPILAGTLGIAHALARLERRRLEWLGIAAPEAYHRPVTETGWRRFRAIARDGQRWRDLAQPPATLVPRVFSFVVAVVWWTVIVAGLSYGLWGRWLPDDNTDLFDLLNWPEGWPHVFGHAAISVLMLASLPLVLRGVTGIDAAITKGLLSNDNASLRERIDRLAATRAAAVSAEAKTLRRVERDIHDGPQQRLVRLTMDLEAANRRLHDDPAAVGPLLDSALTQTQEALAELRALSRGIAPPVLADRGLAAALASAAARCPVPVALEVELPDGRLPTAVENAAYFVVTEALTNVAKHASADQATVRVRVFADDAGGRALLVQVSDDGVGGAHIGKGHGLAGLADRLGAIDGRIIVESPVGGPTVVTAMMPLDGPTAARWDDASEGEVQRAGRARGGLVVAARRSGKAARRGRLFRRGGGG
jgi:signal transduction histidine kinase